MRREAASFSKLSPSAKMAAWMLGLLATLWPWVAFSQNFPAPEKHRPIQVLSDGYVSSKRCQACHPQNHSSWHASYHRTMTQVATPETVATPFEGVDLELHGQSYRLSRDGRQLWVEMPYPPGPNAPHSARVKRRIVLTTGSHHVQNYWFSAGSSRKLELLPFVYLIEEGRWIPEKSSFLLPPSENVSTRPGRWNLACLKCHTTHGRPRMLTEDHMDTQVAEFGIACEACHGPGERHVQIMSQQESLQAVRQGHLEAAIVHPGKLSHQRSAQICGQCHSVSIFQTSDELFDWLTHGFSYRPGEDLTESRFLIRYDQNQELPQLKKYDQVLPRFRANTFWSDGMIKVTGREYSGLLESGCYQRGQMSCLSCHRMHKGPEDARSLRAWANGQLQPGMETNQACLQCHASLETNLEDHTHHRPDSAGSQCYNCHMPHTTYGLLKAIRSHQISSPSVLNSLQTGRPNACNQCHLDKTLHWTAQHLAQWYDVAPPSMSQEEQTIAGSVLWLLRGDANQRALVSWALSWETAREVSGSEWMAPFLAQLLEDPYDAVRFIAYRSLRTLPHFQDFDYDFVGDPGRYSSARSRALEIWRRAREGQSYPRAAEVLIDSDGNLQQKLLYDLLKRRDDRPVSLGE